MWAELSGPDRPGKKRPRRAPVRSRSEKARVSGVGAPAPQLLGVRFCS